MTETETLAVPHGDLDPETAAEAKEQTLPIGTVDAILKAAPADAEEEVVNVPEWDCAVKVRTLNAEAAAEIKGAAATGVMNGSGMDVAGMERIQFRCGVVEPQFTDQQVRQLQKASATGWKRVINAIDALSGGDEKELLEKLQEQFRSQGD